MGAINQDKERRFGELLAPYLAQDDTFCVVSSDFCHWHVSPSASRPLPLIWLFLLRRGSRFGYTSYYPSSPAPDAAVSSLIRLSSGSQISHDFPIWKSISSLDHQAMDILTLPPASGKEAHDSFASYLATTKNTICGRHPIGVLLGALAALDGSAGGQDSSPPRQAMIKWVRYEQSSQCRTTRDSSVSYASAFVVF